MSSRPMVTCICPTYSRYPDDIWMIEECIYWFTKQTYPEDSRRLWILNDNPMIEFKCSTPGVECFNFYKRFASLGAKYNAAMRSIDYTDGRAHIVLPWEDDDISLPHRIETSVTVLGVFGANYWNPKMSFFQNGAGAPLTLCSPTSVHHNTSAFVLNSSTPSYSDTCQPDMIMDRELSTMPGACVGLPKGTKPMYVYRWQHARGRVRNLSGYRNPQKLYDSIGVPVCSTASPQTVPLAPCMLRDYEQESKECWQSSGN